MKECCYIYPGYRGIVCAAGADFTIYGNPGHPEDETQSCAYHLGAMIGTPVWRAEPNTSWTVFPI